MIQKTFEMVNTIDDSRKEQIRRKRKLREECERERKKEFVIREKKVMH